VIMSIQGLYSLLSNYAIVPPVTRRLGSLRLFRLLAISYFLLYLVTPYLVLLPEDMRMPAVYVLVIWKCTFSTMAYPSNAILLANSAPSKQVLGTINGIAASTASLCRALGPTVSGLLYSWGLQTGYSGLAWWFSGLITIVGAYLSLQITEGGGYRDVPSEPQDPLEDERLLADYDDDDTV
jgi:predicted MFS family arabinose efflux permease